MFCFHKFGPVEKDTGMQYCKKCGLAICHHQWEIRKEGTYSRGGVNIATYHILHCKYCGELKEIRLGD